MLLIFPSIEISDKKCLQVVQGLPGSERVYSVDPVQMAVLWRGENAKTLHVVDMQGVKKGKVVNRDVIKSMVEAVDIPIQVGGGLRTFEEIRDVLELGVYRVVVGTAAVEQPGLVAQLVREFGARKIAVGVETWNGQVVSEGGARRSSVTPLELARDMVNLGVSRIVYGDRDASTRAHTFPYDTLRLLAVETKVRITAWGGVNDYKDLVKLQELQKVGVDSVIIGRPLYENRFPCQALWRLNEQELTDLGPTRRI